jgi:hypothetical protein
MFALPVIKEISPLLPRLPASAVCTRNDPLAESTLRPVLNSMDDPTSLLFLC